MLVGEKCMDLFDRYVELHSQWHSLYRIEKVNKKYITRKEYWLMGLILGCDNLRISDIYPCLIYHQSLK